MIIILSLGLLVRTSGQVSLCHATFAAIGAVAFSQLAVDHGMPWFLALLVASLVVVPVGAIVAIPAIRLSGSVPRPGDLRLRDHGRTAALLPRVHVHDPAERSASAATVVRDERHRLLLRRARVRRCRRPRRSCSSRARLGRVLRGLSESPTAVSTMGLSTNTTRVIVFCISAFLAGMSGILYAGSVHFATTQRLALHVVQLAGPAGGPGAGPVRRALVRHLRAIAAVIPGYVTGENTPYWLNVLFGFFAIQVALQGGPPTDAGAICVRSSNGSVAGRLRSKWPRRSARSGSTRSRSGSGHGAAGLEVERLSSPVRRPRRGRRAHLPGARRPHHRAHRPERCRQDDDLRRVQRPQPAGRR